MSLGGFTKNAGGAPLDRRYALSTNEISVSIVGSTVAPPVVQGGRTTITSTGSFGPYTVTFPKSFGTAPRIAATPWLSSASNFVTIALVSVSTTGFTFDMQAFAPGQVVVPNTNTVIIEWMAIGT